MPVVDPAARFQTASTVPAKNAGTVGHVSLPRAGGVGHTEADLEEVAEAVEVDVAGEPWHAEEHLDDQGIGGASRFEVGQSDVALGIRLLVGDG